MRDEVIARRSFEDGELVVSEGDSPHYAYVILSGRAKVLRNLDDEQVQVGIIEEGQLFGEASILGASRRSRTVVADGELELGLIPSDLLSKAVAELPLGAQERLTRMSKDLIYLDDVYVRLSRCIEEFEDLRGTLLNAETFDQDISQLPELPRRIATQMMDRLQTSVEVCGELLRTLVKFDHPLGRDGS